MCVCVCTPIGRAASPKPRLVGQQTASVLVRGNLTEALVVCVRVMRAAIIRGCLESHCHSGVSRESHAIEPGCRIPWGCAGFDAIECENMTHPHMHYV